MESPTPKWRRACKLVIGLIALAQAFTIFTLWLDHFFFETSSPTVTHGD